MKEIHFSLNNESRSVMVESNDTLLFMLREKMGVKSPKCGCERGDCGTCAVLLNGQSVRSCIILAMEVDGQEVVTVEGLSGDGLTPLQKKFVELSSFQCGFCAPGMIISATELMLKNPDPNREEIKEALSGNLCRCTGYTSIIDAVSNTVKETEK